MKVGGIIVRFGSGRIARRPVSPWRLRIARLRWLRHARGLARRYAVRGHGRNLLHLSQPIERNGRQCAVLSDDGGQCH